MVTGSTVQECAELKPASACDGKVRLAAGCDESGLAESDDCVGAGTSIYIMLFSFLATHYPPPTKPSHISMP